MILRLAAPLALALNLLVFGAHALAPFRLARADEPARRLWALAALPALLAAFLATAALVALHPDDALAWGLVDPLGGSLAARLLAVLLAALALCDLLVAIGWRRLEPEAWRLAGAFGVAGVLAHAVGSELLRTGWGPAPASGALFFAAVLLRMPLALAGGELVTGPPRVWCPAAGPALLLAAALWPDALRAELGWEFSVLVAAALVLVLARFVPPRFRRAFGAFGFALAVLFLARAAELARALGVHDALPESFPGL
jgi:hypothetical protein